MKRILVSALAALVLAAGVAGPAAARDRHGPTYDPGYPGPGAYGPPPGYGYGPPPGSGYGYGPPPGYYGPPPGYQAGYYGPRDDRRRRCRNDGAAGAVVGSIIGGAIGNSAAHGRDRGPATVVGAILGGVAGNAIARDSCKREVRRRDRDRYYDDGYYYDRDGYGYHDGHDDDRYRRDRRY